MLRPDWVTLISELTVDPESRLEVRTPMGVFYQPFGDDAREPDYYPIRGRGALGSHPDPDFNHLGMSYLTPVPRGRCGPPDDRLQAGLSGERGDPEPGREVHQASDAGDAVEPGGAVQGRATAASRTPSRRSSPTRALT